MDLPPSPMMRSSPLAGIRVLDCTHLIAGPFCTTMLGDMGADVVKVERPKLGDDLRNIIRYRGRQKHDEDFFYAVNHSKRSIVLDLKSEQGRDVLMQLAARADAAVQNFAPGVAERLGIGTRELRTINPRLVYCSISGFGQTGPLRDRPAVDPILQAMSGVMSVTGDPEGKPMAVGAPIADVAAGMFAAYAIVSALLGAQRTGQGAVIDISMLESMIALISPHMGQSLQARCQPERMGNENPQRVPGGMFETRDGKRIVFQVPVQHFWPPFCKAIEREAWIEDPRFASMQLRLTNRALLHQLVAERLKDLDAVESIRRLSEAGVPCGPVYDFLEVAEDPHLKERGTFASVEHPRSGAIRLAAPPWSSTLGPEHLGRPPLLGEHTGSVLKDWLGWDCNQVDEYLSSLPI